jgi:MFS transporter, DHA1 family, multidrug resistance protein
MSCKIANADIEPLPIPVVEKRESNLKHALILGMLVTVGALGIDTYLPAFPQIARSYGVTEGQVQLSLVSYFLALAVGQIVYGPLSDRIGRRIPLLAGFLLFVVASVGVAMAPNLPSFIALRFVQGLGACAGMVIPRAIVRDIRSGEEAARLFALMLLVLGVSPIFAPLLGSFLIQWLPWKSVFWFLTVFGAICWFTIYRKLDETHPVENRSSDGIGMAFKSYGRLLRDRRFMITVLVGGFSQAVLFAYLAGSPFVYIKLHGVDPTIYSILFAINGAGLIGIAQANVYFMRRLGPSRLLLMATGVQAASATVLLVATLLNIASLPLIIGTLFVCLGTQGLTGPTTGMLAMEPHPEIAGAASAMMGTLQFACGVVSAGLLSLIFNGTAVPFAVTIAVCALIGLSLAVWIARENRAIEEIPVAATA